jgi:hypothetical protein
VWSVGKGEKGEGHETAGRLALIHLLTLPDERPSPDLGTLKVYSRKGSLRTHLPAGLCSSV